MTKKDIIAALERMPGDPEIEITVHQNVGDSFAGIIDHIVEIPRPTIIIIEK